MSDAIKLFLGPIFIGSEFHRYYLSKRRLQDSKVVRSLVAYELVLDTFSSAIAVYVIWLCLVDNFMNAEFLTSAPWPLTAVPLFTAMCFSMIPVGHLSAQPQVRIPIQTFLAWRVFKLSNSWFIFGLLRISSMISRLVQTSVDSAAFATFLSIMVLVMFPTSRIYTTTLSVTTVRTEVTVDIREEREDTEMNSLRKVPRYDQQGFKNL
ncbi:hypothetical protein C8R43DRAFT_944333 [Mycena crocata]|nr:hypothetical protein C8R43DRAFT_944333 [Mycena crocata]